jgi:hypothetical protein
LQLELESTIINIYEVGTLLLEWDVGGQIFVTHSLSLSK